MKLKTHEQLYRFNHSYQWRMEIEVGRERDYLSWTRALVTGGLQTCNPRFQSSEFLFHLQLFKALGV